MKNEAHLSAEQTTKKKDPWFPGPHENCRGPQGHQTPPPRRTQDTGPLITNRFPQRLKLKKRSEFQKIFKQGQRAVGRLICIDWRVSGLQKQDWGLRLRAASDPPMREIASSDWFAKRSAWRVWSCLPVWISTLSRAKGRDPPHMEIDSS